MASFFCCLQQMRAHVNQSIAVYAINKHLLAAIAQQDATNVLRRRDLTTTVAVYVIVSCQSAVNNERQVRFRHAGAGQQAHRDGRFLPVRGTVWNLRRWRGSVGQAIFKAQRIRVRPLDGK